MDQRPPFAPDPSYELPDSLSSRFAFWVDHEAARHLLSGVAAVDREVLAGMLMPVSDALNQNLPRIEPTGIGALDQALYDLYAVRPSADFPFERPA